jgi:hypothetical protein
MDGHGNHVGVGRKSVEALDDLENGAPTMLILDEMSAHMTTDVRNAIAVCDTHLVLIPGGYTSKLQVMDVGFNKPFKNHYRDF